MIALGLVMVMLLVLLYLMDYLLLNSYSERELFGAKFFFLVILVVKS